MVMKRKGIIVKQGKTPIHNKTRKTLIIYAAAIAVITFSVYTSAFDNDFTNWDDSKYVTENNSIQNIGISNIRTFFSTNLLGNYQPLTAFSLAIDYKIGKLNPKTYHIHNVLLHLLNTLLLFYFLYILFRKNKNRMLFALIAALLFGVHSLHVESVTWVSERKDVLYSFYFLLSIILYVKYCDKRNLLYYSLSILLFLLSLLSKGQATALVVVLMAIDYMKERSVFKKNILLEKIPFLLLAIIFGIIAIKAQDINITQSAAASFPLWKKFMFACYGFWQYIAKLIFPFKLSAFYPYPEKLSFIYIVSPFITIPLLSLIYFFRRNKTVVFGSVFFIANIALVIQLLPVGSAIMADRYSYLSSVGFFVIASYLILYLSEKYGKSIIISLFVIYITVLSVITYKRNNVWDNSMSLWNDVLSKHKNVPVAWGNRGLAKKDMGRDFYAEALADYDSAISYDTNYSLAYSNRGNVRFELGDTAGAFSDYYKAISLSPNDYFTYNKLGVAFAHLGKFEEALPNFDKAINIMPDISDTYANRGNALQMLGRYDSALSDYNKSISLNPENVDTYANMGILKLNMKNFPGAITDFSAAIRLMPDNSMFYLMRGDAYYDSGNISAACNDMLTAAKKGNKQAEEIYRQRCR